MNAEYVFLFVFGIIVVMIGCMFIGIGCYSLNTVGEASIVSGIGIIATGVCIIVASCYANNSAKEREALESEAVESYREGAELYINGEKKDNINLKGVNLDNYDIVIEKDKIYLKEKQRKERKF